MNVYIEYGLSEGPRHSRRLHQALREAGHTVVLSAEGADVVISHSGGGYLLAKQIHPRLILLVGLTYWEGKHPLQGVYEKLRLERKNRSWYSQMSASIFYLFTQPRHWLAMRSAFYADLMPDFPDAKIVLVRNENDPHIHPEASQALAREKGWEYVGLPGQHDDLWDNPQPYVDLIKRFGTSKKS